MKKLFVLLSVLLFASYLFCEKDNEDKLKEIMKKVMTLEELCKKSEIIVSGEEEKVIIVNYGVSDILYTILKVDNVLKNTTKDKVSDMIRVKLINKDGKWYDPTFTKGKNIYFLLQRTDRKEEIAADTSNVLYDIVRDPKSVMKIDIGTIENIKAINEMEEMNPKTDDRGKIEFLKQESDFGIVKQGEIVKLAMVIVNNSKKELIINTIDAECTCTKIKEYEHIVAPGKKLEVSIEYDTKGKEGKQKTEVAVLSNNPQQPVMYFKLIGEVTK